MMRSLEIKMREWVIASSSFGQKNTYPPIVDRIEYDRAKETQMTLGAGIPSFVYIDKQKIVVNDPFRDKPLDKNDNIFQFSSLERDIYDEGEADLLIKHLYEKFVDVAGFVTAKIHIAKRVFSSNKATLCIIVSQWDLDE